jgi:hypothetical protein
LFDSLFIEDELIETKMQRPDISFQLIFCFLNLQELSNIAQCCKEYRRMSTSKSFINMYSNTVSVVDIKQEYEWASLVSSPFKNIVENVAHCCVYPNMISMFTQLNRLKKLDLYISTGAAFEQIGHFKPTPLLSLCELYVAFREKPDFYSFLRDICLFYPKLTKLDIEIIQRPDQLNISAICQMQHLEVLRLNFNYENFHQFHAIIIDTVRLMPALKILNVNELFCFHNSNGHLPSSGLVNLRRLCEKPGAPPSLTTILHFDGDLIGNQLIECAQLLENLSSLKSIELIKIGNLSSMPISLAKWVTRVKIRSRNFFNFDIDALLHFNRMNSIDLIYCSLSIYTMLSQIITFNASRLKKLGIRHLRFEPSTISFDTISRCKELETLYLENCGGLLASEFHLLHQCSKLKFIRILFCHLEMNDLTIQQQKSLEIGSSVFPSLKQCTLYT